MCPAGGQYGHEIASGGRRRVVIHRWSDPCLTRGMGDAKQTPVWITVAFVVVGALGVALIIRGAANHLQEQEKSWSQPAAPSRGAEPAPLPTLAPRTSGQPRTYDADLR